MANPYYVQPAMPLQGIQLFGQALTRRQDLARQQAEQQKELNLRQNLSTLLDTGSDEQIHKFLVETPGASKIVNDITASIDEREKQMLLSSARRTLILGENPADVLTDLAEQEVAEGMDATKTIEDVKEAVRNPELSIKQAERALAILDPTASKVYQSQRAGGTAKPTANIQDYKYYQELLGQSPEEASKFARMVGITEDEEKEIKPTSKQREFQQYQAMPEGKEKENFGRLIGIKPQETAKEAQQRIEKEEETRVELLGAETTVDLIDQIMNTPGYIENLSGISGKIWSKPGSVAFDSEVVFEQLKNSMTLDNLEKMSGVLSDSDIKLLRSASSGLEPGMSEKSMRKRLEQIKKVIQDKVTRKREQLPKEDVEAAPARLIYNPATGGFE